MLKSNQHFKDLKNKHSDCENCDGEYLKNRAYKEDIQNIGKNFQQEILEHVHLMAVNMVIQVLFKIYLNKTAVKK